MVKNPPALRETWVWSLGWEDPLEEGLASTAVFLSGESPWTEKPGGLQSRGSQRVRHNWVTKHIYIYMYVYFHLHEVVLHYRLEMEFLYQRYVNLKFSWILKICPSKKLYHFLLSSTEITRGPISPQLTDAKYFS